MEAAFTMINIMFNMFVMLVFTFQTVCIASKNTALLFHTFVKSSRKMFRQGVRDINDEFEEQNRKSHGLYGPIS